MDTSISGSNRRREEIRTFISNVGAAVRCLKSVWKVPSERVPSSWSGSGRVWYVAWGSALYSQASVPIRGRERPSDVGLIRLLGHVIYGNLEGKTGQREGVKHILRNMRG